MKNLNFWSKFFILNFWSSRCSRLLRPCTKWRGQKKIKSMSFHQYSWNSEVETTWISLIGWHHKTSTVHPLLAILVMHFFFRVKVKKSFVTMPFCSMGQYPAMLGFAGIWMCQYENTFLLHLRVHSVLHYSYVQLK